MAQIVNIPKYIESDGNVPFLIYEFEWSDEFDDKYVLCDMYGTHGSTSYADEQYIDGKRYIIVVDNYLSEKYNGSYKHYVKIWKDFGGPAIENSGEERIIITKNEFLRKDKLKRIIK